MYKYCDHNAKKTLCISANEEGKEFIYLESDDNYVNIPSYTGGKVLIKEFNIKPNKNLQLVNDNALFYVRKSNQKYDLIIIDLFIDNEVPKDFYEADFWDNIYNITSKGGSILFNASTIEHVRHEIENILPTLNDLFFIQQMNKVEGSNTLILGTKK
jgi:hypothetical protein